MATSTPTTTPKCPIASPESYLPLRLALLEKEKAHTRAHDAITAERRALPLVEITKPYTFATLDPNGQEKTVTLLDLFEGRRQLIVKHFMFGPDSTEGCVSCSMGADYLVALEHLHSRSTTLICTSLAPIQKLHAYKTRMQWTFPWYSTSHDPTFNHDFHVTSSSSSPSSSDPNNITYNFRTKSELLSRGLTYSTQGEQPGMSCFIQGGKGIGEEGKVYHTYSTYARGLEAAGGDVMGLLDLTVLGRQEVGNQPASKRRDEYTEEELRGAF